jgi:uroporphyrin-III C-methyltransferase
VTVYLVGAGPGDPGLITVHGFAVLTRADVVVYDRLASPTLLDVVPAGAELVSAGKAPGSLDLTQDEINALLVDRGRAVGPNGTVVRLKGGDPFVFGRGGEEALALQRAGVAYDVVPGVTSAIAAPGAAGIPVTHRGIASAFLVVSAHEESAFAAAIGALQPNGITVVVLMGLARSAVIACRLIDNGWSLGTPAAIVVDATKPQQQVWRGTLGELAADTVEIDGDGAGTIVVGDVVAVKLNQEREPFRRAADQEREPVRRAFGGDHVSRG